MSAPLPAPSWLRVKHHAEQRIEAIRTALEAAQADAIPALQAEIRVWRQVIDLPTILSDERIEPDLAGYA